MVRAGWLPEVHSNWERRSGAAMEHPVEKEDRLKYEKADGLTLVSSEHARPAAVLDVVFVHGLGGGAYSTWFSGEASELGFWPAKLAEEHPSCCVWTLQYDTPMFEWNPLSRSNIDLLDRAAWLVETLVQVQSDKKLPTRPLVFVAHSLGGVLVKQALQFASLLGGAGWRNVWEQTRAVAFLATPHDGARIADVAIRAAETLSGPFSRLVFRPSRALNNLVDRSPTLRYLSTWYRDQSPEQGIETLAFYEGLTYNGVLVVDQSTANPQIANSVVIPMPQANHRTIAKPATKSNLVYAEISGLLSRLEVTAATAATSHFEIGLRPRKLTLEQQRENQELISRLCGFWWERINVEDETAISLFRIARDPVFNRLTLSGTGYYADGRKSANWGSELAVVDRTDGKLAIKYLWMGRHTTAKLAGIPFHGFGVIKFEEPLDPAAPFRRGDGQYYNVNEINPEQTVIKPTEVRRVNDVEEIRPAYEKGTEAQVAELIAQAQKGW
ncbi:MAG: alpha/beta fold hydrolase [Steroidobacteraceae bacterium]